MSDRSGVDDAPSAIVTRGRIKVDARRAIRKLRDHLLVDLHLYTTELARVAVAIGATKLDVEWDADDVIMTFDGAPLGIDAVSRARDHVLTPESDVTDGDALRVLGIGISAALGLAPLFADVYVADAADTSGCARVRFEAVHIDEEADAAAPAPARVSLPKGMPRPGMRVHVRKRVDLNVLSRAVRRDVPREVALLIAATRDSRLALTVNAERPPEVPGPTVLLRVDLDEPSATRACLEVLAPARGVGPRTLLLDLGVHLAEVAGVGLREPHDAELPLRVVLDARRLPTNASRSEVRTDAELLVRIRSRIPAALDAALAMLEKIVRGEAAPAGSNAHKIGHFVEILDPRPALHAQALGAIAASVAIAMRIGKDVSAGEEALLRLPLLRNAVGAPMSLADVRGGTNEHPLLVYVGDSPAAPELAPWLAGVVWLNGSPAERALAGLTQASANERVALASEGHARRARALEHPASEPVLPASSAYLLKEAFTVGEGPFAGLHGEVAVVKRERGYQRSSTARLFVDERLLETVQLPGVALPLDMSLAWPAGFQPRLAYDGVERDERLSHAIVYALRVAAIAVGERLGAADAELGRLAILAYASATQTLGDAAPARTALGRLAEQAVWPTSDGGLVTLAAIEAYAHRTGAICVAAPGSGSAADGRPVALAEHGKALLGLLQRPAVIVDYGVFLARGAAAAQQELAAQGELCLVKVPLARESAEGFVGVGPNRKRIFHGGTQLRDEAFAFRNGPVLVAVEDRAAVPSADHRALLYSSADLADTGREEDALLDLVVDQCERGALSLPLCDDYLVPAKRNLVARINAKRRSDDLVWLAAILKRVEELPAVVERNRIANAKAEVLARPVLARPDRSSRSATVVTRSGTVTVTLGGVETWEAAAAEVRFEGRHVAETSALELPATVVVDVVREYFLKDWTELSTAGLSWARETARQAALDLLSELGPKGELATNPPALRLCEALMLGIHTEQRPRVANILRNATWPTVQGGAMTLPEAGPVPFGSDAFVPYRTGAEESPYDAPSLHVPRGSSGELQTRVLTRAGFTLQDVTEATARLQALRARGQHAKSPPPRLSGEPAHPRLRESLAKLGATRAEGELELAADQTSIARVNARGTTEPLALAVLVPMRAIVRTEDATHDELQAELAGGAIRHLRALGGSLDGLPEFVRDRLRMVVCEAVRRGMASPGDDSYPVFCDQAGAFWSLAQLLEIGAIRRTRDLGRSTLPNDGGPILCLSDADASALASVLRTEDVTEELREAQRGFERRAAPPLETIELTAALRAECIFTFTFDEEGMRGEIGVLRPAHSAALRGIALHTTKRLLTSLEDGGAWPTVAAIDIDGIETTRAFDGLALRADIARIQRRVRGVLAARAVDILPAPRGALGVVRLPVPFLARSDAASSTELPVPCLGVFWLTPEWPEAPTVHLEGFDFVDPFRVPRMPPVEGAHHRVLPIAGKVWVCADAKRADAALGMACRFVRERLAPLVASASHAPHGISPSEREAYAWDLRLLGATSDADPVVELALDRPAPSLMRVAARRAPHLIDAATGDAGHGTPAATVPAHAARAETPPAHPDPPAELPDTAAPEAPPGETFLRGLVRWVVELVTPAPPRLSETPLTQALHKALAAMKLTGDPVELVVESSRGRPVRYDAKTKRVIVNAAHESVVALETHPSRVLFLLAAAVSEINRELVPVTDAEELAVIVDLLRDG